MLATELLADPVKTILLVEDDDAVRSVITKFLRRAGYAVLDFPNGELALEMLRQYAGPIDLLVTDTMLPGISGADTAIRVLAMRPELPLLFMSGYTEDIVRDAIPAGLPAVFLAKPFRTASLVACIGKILHDRPDTHAAA